VRLKVRIRFKSNPYPYWDACCSPIAWEGNEVEGTVRDADGTVLCSVWYTVRGTVRCVNGSCLKAAMADVSNDVSNGVSNDASNSVSNDVSNGGYGGGSRTWRASWRGWKGDRILVAVSFRSRARGDEGARV